MFHLQSFLMQGLQAKTVHLSVCTSIRHEITSWLEPAYGIGIKKVPITPEMMKEHQNACEVIAKDPTKWTSHTVAVVDQSGSMRKNDTEDAATRSDVVWLTLALDLVRKKLESGEVTAMDMFSVVRMGGSSDVLLRQQPTDWVLYNNLVHILLQTAPLGDGCYLPALDEAEDLLLSNPYGGCALMLLFLSDGRPSDNRLVSLPKGSLPVSKSEYSAKGAWWVTDLQERISRLAARFGRRLTVGMIGFGANEDEFHALEAMAAAPAAYGAHGVFHSAALSTDALSTAFTSLSQTLTSTSLEMTAVSGKRLTVRDVLREQVDLRDGSCVTEDWEWFPEEVVRWVWDYNSKSWVRSGPLSPKAKGYASSKAICGEGAERMVWRFREVDHFGDFVGPELVAKHSRFVEDFKAQDWKAFHTTFCRTQAQAQRLAEEFNAQLAKVPGVDDRTPRIMFLDCAVYPNGYLVERRLDPKRYTKWNNNAGYIKGQAGLPPLHRGAGASDQPLDGTGSLDEPIRIDPLDIPQAFSHFTYLRTNRERLVCDLQGVLNTECTPPRFELTDPAIHRWDRWGGSSYGRTDKGATGVKQFFKTHRCSPLCALINRRWVHKNASAVRNLPSAGDREIAPPSVVP